jgi:hypothetical protein
MEVIEFKNWSLRFNYYLNRYKECYWRETLSKGIRKTSMERKTKLMSSLPYVEPFCM